MELEPVLKKRKSSNGSQHSREASSNRSCIHSKQDQSSFRTLPTQKRSNKETGRIIEEKVSVSNYKEDRSVTNRRSAQPHPDIDKNTASVQISNVQKHKPSTIKRESSTSPVE